MREAKKGTICWAQIFGTVLSSQLFVCERAFRPIPQMGMVVPRGQKQALQGVYMLCSFPLISTAGVVALRQAAVVVKHASTHTL